MASQVSGYIGKIDPGNGTEYALGSTAYGYCQTAADTAAKVVDMTGFQLVTGATIFVKFQNKNSASNPTLNVNGTGAKNIYRYGTTRPGTTDATNGWAANSVLAFTYDGSGWIEHYWYNNQYNMGNNSLGNGNFTADSAIYRYQLLFHTDDETLTPLNNANNDVTTEKTMLVNVEFDPLQRIYYYDSTTAVAAAGGVAGSALYYSRSGIDLRYTFNCGTTSFTAHKFLYLKVKIQENSKCKIAAANPLVQDLPSTADGYHYILLGRTYSAYQVCLYPEKPVYYHDGEKIQIYDGKTASGGGSDLPSGGLTGQVLVKNSSVDGDANWYYPGAFPTDKWYLVTGITESNVIAAYQFVYRLNEIEALVNINEGPEYALTPTGEDITWIAKKGFFIPANNRGVGLDNENLQSAYLDVMSAAFGYSGIDTSIQRAAGGIMIGGNARNLEIIGYKGRPTASGSSLNASAINTGNNNIWSQSGIKNQTGVLGGNWAGSTELYYNGEIKSLTPNSGAIVNFGSHVIGQRNLYESSQYSANVQSFHVTAVAFYNVALTAAQHLALAANIIALGGIS